MTTDLSPVPATSPGVIATLHPSGGVSTWLSPSSFEQGERIAALMAKCGTLPEHLRDKPADCFRIVVQSAKWRIDPYSVAECTSLVHGRLCYEGKLVASVLYQSGVIDGRFQYTITGEGQASEITVTATPRGAGKPESIHGSVKGWRTFTKDKNGNPLPNNWDKDPHSQLVYRGTRQWARIHAPDALLGVYTRDEMDEPREVQATVVPDVKPAKAREVQAEVVSTETKSAPPARPIGELVSLANAIHADFGSEGLVAIRKFMDAIGVKKVADCPADRIANAYELLKAIERELHEGGAK